MSAPKLTASFKVGSYIYLPPHMYPLTSYLRKDVTQEEYTRLLPALQSWARLNELLILDTFTLEDIKVLIILEVAYSRRLQVMDKLVGRYTSQIRQHVLTLLNNAILQTGAKVPDVLHGANAHCAARLRPARKKTARKHPRASTAQRHRTRR